MASSLSPQEVLLIFERFPQYRAIDTFVETGTLHGETVVPMREIFPHCHSIELSPAFYENVCRLFGHTDINFHCGDSVEVLGRLIPTFEKPVFFFLDAHWSSGPTARGPVDVPLLQELQLIAPRNQKDVIVIDDYRLFGKTTPEDWTAITEESVANALNGRFDASFAANDRLFILR